MPPQYKLATYEDIKDDSRTTPIPDRLIDGETLIAGVQGAEELSAINIVQYNFPAVMILLSTVLAGKIRCGDIHPSCFFIRVGPTSSGKTQTDKSLKRLLAPKFGKTAIQTDGRPSETINTLYGATNFASGAGLLKTVCKKNRQLITIDEMTYMFACRKSDSNAIDKRTVLLELSTAAGQRIEKAYGEEAKNVIIEDVCVNMIGNATPSIFDTFTLNDLEDGLIQRFDFFCYDAPIPYRTSQPDADSPAALKFADGLTALHAAEKPAGTFDPITDSAVDIGITAPAKELCAEYSKKIIDFCNGTDSEGVKGIISRKYDASIKFALIHAGASRDPEDLFWPLSSGNIKYGQFLADLLADWKLKALVGGINAGQFDAHINMFIKGAKASLKAKKPPTGKMIVNRQPKLKNLTSREFDDIVRVCKARKLIQVREDKGRTLYEPIIYV